MKKLKILLLGMLCFLGLNASTEIIQLTPEQVENKLLELFGDEIINDQTLFVWDIDKTLIQDGSDFTIDGAIPIRPSFAPIIKMMQSAGITHIALTAASPYKTDFTFDFNDELTLSISRIVFDLHQNPDQINPKDCCPEYFKEKCLNSNPCTTFVSEEAIRIEGLNHININFDGPQLSDYSGVLDIMKCTLKYLPNFDENVSKRRKVIKSWISPETQERHRFIAMNILQDNRKRYFIQTKGSLEEILYVPIFSHGVIFANFINSFTHFHFGYIKGRILDTFLQWCEKKTGQKISNIVFIDDTFDCVKNVFESMKSIGKPCIAIHILTPKINF